MRRIPVIFLMLCALMVPSYSQAQNNNGADVQTPSHTNQSAPQSESIRKHSNAQRENTSQPAVQTQVQNTQPAVQEQYYNQPYVQEQNQAQVYYTQPYVQEQVYYNEPMGQNPNYPTRPYNSPNEAFAEGQWYSVDTYPQPPIYVNEQNAPVQKNCCPAPKVNPPKQVTCCSKNWEGSLEVRVADFYPLDSAMRDIYDCGIPFYQAEASFSAGGPVSAWLNAGYLGKSGRSIGEEDRTYLRLVPVGFGLKYAFYLPYCWKAYIGAGPAWSFLTIRDHSDFNHRIERDALGAMVKLGLTYEFWRCVQLDLFVDYYYTEFKFSGNRNCIRRNNLDVSALIFGAGLGWAF